MATTERNKVVRELLAEVVLSVLPVLVILLVLLYVGEPGKLFKKPEWAFGAAILFGQSLVRLVSSLTAPHPRLQRGTAALLASTIIVFGLTSSLLVLVLVVLSIEQGKAVGQLFQWTQSLLFAASALTYVVVGAVSHEVSHG